MWFWKKIIGRGGYVVKKEINSLYVYQPTSILILISNLSGSHFLQVKFLFQVNLSGLVFKA